MFSCCWFYTGKFSITGINVSSFNSCSPELGPELSHYLPGQRARCSGPEEKGSEPPLCPRRIRFHPSLPVGTGKRNDRTLQPLRSQNHFYDRAVG